MEIEKLGGEGSGNFDHLGRPGEVGGSGEGKEIKTKERVEAIHGTISPYLNEIIREGIVGGKHSNWDEGFFQGQREGRVFVSKDEFVADHYARQAWLKKGGNVEGNRPIRIKEAIPKEEWKKLAKKDLSAGKGAKSYMLPNIKPEWIESYTDILTNLETRITQTEFEEKEILYIPVPKKSLKELLKIKKEFTVKDFIKNENKYFGITVDDFLTYTRRRKLTKFEEKVDFSLMEKELDTHSVDMFKSLSEILRQTKNALLKRCKFILDKKLVTEIDRLTLAKMGEFKNTLRDELIKTYLDSKVEALQEVQRGGEPIQITLKFASTANRWEAVPPQEAMDLFRNKINARIVKEDGTKKLITLITRQELTYYNQRAFAVTGIVDSDILDETKMILLKAISGEKDYSATEQMLSDVFDRYIESGILKDDKLVTPNRLTTIVRTNVNEAFNLGRMEMFKDEDVVDLIPYYQWSAILDNRTTDYCKDNDGKIFDAKDPMFLQPPAHFNCRSIVVAITKREAERMKRNGEIIEVSKFTPFDVNFYTEKFGEREIKPAELETIVRCPKEGCGSDNIIKALEDETFVFYKCLKCNFAFRRNKDTGRIMYWEEEVKSWLPLTTAPSSRTMLGVL